MFTEFNGSGTQSATTCDDGRLHARKIKRTACRTALSSQAIGAQSGGLVLGGRTDLGNCSVADRKSMPG